MGLWKSPPPTPGRRVKQFSRAAEDSVVTVHQLKEMKGSVATTKCGKTVYYTHEWSGWNSDITCRECRR